MRPGCGLEFGVCWGCIAEHTLLVAKTAENSPEHRLHKPSSTNKVRRGGGLGPGLFADPSPAEEEERQRERATFLLAPQSKAKQKSDTCNPPG